MSGPESVGSSRYRACPGSVAPVLLTVSPLQVCPRAAHSFGLRGIRVAICATHPAGGRCAAAVAATGVEGALAHATTHRLKPAPIRASWIILATAHSS